LSRVAAWRPGRSIRAAERAVTTRSGAPASVEAALRKLRVLATVIVAIRLFSVPESREVLSWPWLLATAGAFAAVNLVSMIGQRGTGRAHPLLDAVQLIADSTLVLIVLWVGHDEPNGADWAILVLPVLEGAIRFQLVGAVASWTALSVGYIGWNVLNQGSVSIAELVQRMLVVLLVALPSGFLAGHLVDEIEAQRRARDEAERRSSLLRAAALGGRRSTSLDVDEVLDTLRATVGQIGFADPTVFEIEGPAVRSRLVARAVRYSRRVLGIPPGDPRILAAAKARDAGGPVVWPAHATAMAARAVLAHDTPRTEQPVLVAVPVAVGEEGVVMLTARWPHPGAPPASQCEGLELCAAQAGASLRNAQVHQELEALKDALAHEAAHDALTGIANSRRFHERLERVCGRGRPGELLAVLFLDLDGLKEVNDRYGHDIGNELLIAVADRLQNCARFGDLVARMGGDEFTIMLTRLESAAPAAEVADRICAILTEPFLLDAHTVRISTSIGIAVAPADRAVASDLVRRADVAMYQAKRLGKAGWSMDPGSLEQSDELPA
jgi:diguanylate cyclase (GGDEF)-like protein